MKRPFAYITAPWTGSACQNNEKALRYCRELGCTPIGGSDAHIEKQVGVYATWLPQEVHTLEEFIALLRAGQTKPARWTGQGYEVLDEF